MERYLTSKLNKYSLKYPNFEFDLEKEVALQRVALQIVKLQQRSGLSLEEFANLVNLRSSNISRMQSGRYNPTIITLIDIAFRCGNEIEIKIKPKKNNIKHQ